MELPKSNSGNLMLLAELVRDDEEDPLAEAACEDEEDPLPSIDPPLIEAFRNPETRRILVILEEKIQKFIPTCSQVIQFPTFHTRYLADISCMLARRYRLEQLSVGSTKFCKTPHCMPLPALSSIIPPFQPERKVKTLKEREKFFKDLGVIINPGRLSSISPVIPQSTSPVPSGMVIEGGQDPDSASDLSSLLTPLSLEPLPLPRPESAKLPSPGVPLRSISPVIPQSTSPVPSGMVIEGGQDPNSASDLSSTLTPLSLEPLPLPRPESAKLPSPSVPQNQDLVNFPHPMEDEEPNYNNAQRPPQRRRLMD